MPEVTHQPAGEYPKAAPVHSLDLEAAATSLLETLPGHRRQTRSLARESGVSVIMMAMEGGDVLDKHHANGAVTVHLLDGHATLTARDETIDLRPGQLVMMQPNVTHNLRAEEQSVVLLTVTGGEA